MHISCEIMSSVCCAWPASGISIFHAATDSKQDRLAGR